MTGPPAPGDIPRAIAYPRRGCPSSPARSCSAAPSSSRSSSPPSLSAPVVAPLSGGAPYVAECNDIIEALGMTYAEGNAFKAIWRLCAARTLGAKKRGYTDGLYDAEKVAFFGARMVAQERACKQTEPSA